MTNRRLYPFLVLALMLASCQFNNPFDEDNELLPPTFEPLGQIYQNPITLKLSTKNTQLDIKYSFDNQNCNNIYTGPVQLPSPGREKEVKVWAKTIADKNSSKVLQQTYIFKVGSPVFSLDNSHAHEGIQTLTLTSVTDGASIYYTTDGSDPTISSTPYTEPFSLVSSTTVKAIALKQGFYSSDVATRSYTIYGIVGVPIFNPPGGEYYTTQDVAITTSTQGAEIRYTTDGSEPVATSSLYNQPIHLSLGHITIFKAKAFKTNWQPSSVATAQYNINTIVATPTFSPPGGFYDTYQQFSVSISCSTPGATIRYTTNGSDPTANSSLYTTPISVNTNKTLKACAFKDGWQNSPMGTASYTGIGPWSEGFESNNLTAYPWVNNSPQPWFITTGAYSGSYCARSGHIPHSGTTSLQITRTGKSGYVSFHRRVSSEPSSDYLIFFIDNVEKARWAGNQGWQNFSYWVPIGTHTYKWVYMKNGTGTSGSDCAWIDDVYIP